ncbi:hypothetical protein BCR35DRAFT_332341 [Leucosporidium creatinivorum]|uniref:Uncharacterized protein n=1 Tax=Leucosporidium creatinivorum TaxID=106004 RepID=A0A1Y2F3H4_9BASI|nr:hypothetical protein BCR35DRAFT_332341 [Leucosporidium creatinivorum]
MSDLKESAKPSIDLAPVLLPPRLAALVYSWLKDEDLPAPWFLELKQIYRHFSNDSWTRYYYKALNVHSNFSISSTALYFLESTPLISMYSRLSGAATQFKIELVNLLVATVGDKFNKIAAEALQFCQDMNAYSFAVYRFVELTPDLEGGSFSGVVGKLFLRVFPEQYAFNSAYALFAFSTPQRRRTGLSTSQHPSQRLHPLVDDPHRRACYTYVYLDFEPKDGFALRKRAPEYSHILGHIVSMSLTRVGNIADVLAHITERPARAFYTAINANKGQLLHEDISHPLISALITLVNIAQVIADATDFYLDKREIANDINRLANANNEAADQRITAYIMESLRLSPVVPGVMRKAKLRVSAAEAKEWLENDVFGLRCLDEADQRRLDGCLLLIRTTQL